ncbi:MAG: DUF3592 domain-containing protein [Planctomycetes bacterium]|nr:DUF3592 domain-containing protein [Planctomycetota bacterium]
MVATSTSWHTMAEVDAMRSWVEVPAIIRQAELKVNVRHNHGYRGREGPPSRSKRTYQLIALYDYEFGGRRFTGDRVSVYGNSHTGDNISSFLSNAYLELLRHRDPRTPFRCFVNPRQPYESVLYRELRWGMAAAYTLFATLFGAIGFGFLTGVLVSSWRRLRLRAAQPMPDAPWLARTDWAAGKIRARGGTAVALPILAVLVVWWTIASLPLVTRLTEIFESTRNPFAVVTLVFPAVGTVLVLALVYQFIRRLKFGQSMLELASSPGVVGGQLAGVVRIPRVVRTTEGFLLKLSCIENGDSENPLWRKERRVTEPMRDRAGEAIAVPVLFAILYKAKETSPADSRRKIQWRLAVSAETPGVDYEAQFDVPVFKTPDSRPDFELDERAVAEFEAAPQRNTMFRAAGIIKVPLPDGGVRLVFRAARNLETAVPLTVITVLWSGAIWMLLRAGWIVLPIVFGLIDLLLIWWAARVWLYRSSVEARPDGLTLQGGLLGIGRQRSIPADEVEKITEEWDNIVVVLSDKKQRMIARSIEGQLTQRAVVTELKAALRPDFEGSQNAQLPRARDH